jgi:hypothetical protein
VNTKRTSEQVELVPLHSSHLRAPLAGYSRRAVRRRPPLSGGRAGSHASNDDRFSGSGSGTPSQPYTRTRDVNTHASAWTRVRGEVRPKGDAPLWDPKNSAGTRAGRRAYHAVGRLALALPADVNELHPRPRREPTPSAAGGPGGRTAAGAGGGGAAVGSQRLRRSFAGAGRRAKRACLPWAMPSQSRQRVWSPVPPTHARVSSAGKCAG